MQIVNLLGLLSKVVNKYGSQYHDFVIALKQTPQPTFDNLIIRIFIGLLVSANELKADLRQRSSLKRINLRNKINLEIGIYSDKYCIFE